VSEANQVGGDEGLGKGFYYQMAGFENGRLQTAARAVGVMQAAYEEALKGYQEGGIPIGSVLTRHGKLIAKGHNKRVQEKNPILHGEMDCLNNAGRIGTYKDTVIYSTLMPCYMCAGTVVQFGIKKVIVGESKTFPGW
jgi:cytosine deaminase